MDRTGNPQGPDSSVASINLGEQTRNKHLVSDAYICFANQTFVCEQIGLDCEQIKLPHVWRVENCHRCVHVVFFSGMIEPALTRMNFDDARLSINGHSLEGEIFLRYTNHNSEIRWETKMGGPPELKPAVYRKANVLPDVAQIKAPLLILHGEEDPQVPPQESQEFAAALKRPARRSLTSPIRMRDMVSSSGSIGRMPTNASWHSLTNI
jgi:hypothetical protein